MQLERLALRFPLSPSFSCTRPVWASFGWIKGLALWQWRRCSGVEVWGAGKITIAIDCSLTLALYGQLVSLCWSFKISNLQSKIWKLCCQKILADKNFNNTKGVFHGAICFMPLCSTHAHMVSNWWFFNGRRRWYAYVETMHLVHDADNAEFLYYHIYLNAYNHCRN